MKLRSLTLNHFRQHKQIEITFLVGITGVVGQNGSGKTTILEAISFALYGSKAIRGKVEDLKTRSSEKKDQLKVILEFETNNLRYKLTRTLTDAELVLEIENKTIAIGLKDVTTSIEQILNMNYDEFSSTYLTEQKSLEFLGTKKSATERERFITKMLGFYRIERLQDKIRTEKNSLKNEIQGISIGIGDSNHLELLLNQEKQKLIEIQVKFDEADKNCIKLEKDLKQTRIVFERLEKQKVEIEREEQLINDFSIKLQTIDSQIDQIKQEVQKFNNKKYEEILLEINQIKEDLNIKTAEFNIQKEEFINQRAKITFEINSINQEITSVDSNLSLLLKTDKKKTSEIDTCSLCGQTIDRDTCVLNITKKHESLKLKRLELLELDKEVKSKDIELLNKEKILKEKQQRLKSLELEEKSFETFRILNQQIAKLEEEKNLFLKNNQKLLAQKENLEVEDVKSKNEHILTSYIKVKAQQEVEARLFEVSRLARLRIEGELQTQKAILSKTTEQLSQIDLKQRSLTEKKRRFANLESTDLYLTDFRRYLNSTLRPMLAERASEYLTDLTDGRYTTIELGQDFSPIVIEDGEPKPVISGGEEDIVNLSMRLSLSSILADRAGHDFSLLILDEIFGALDEQRRNNVLFLLEKLGGRFEQIILVSHLEDVKDGVEHVVEV